MQYDKNNVFAKIIRGEIPSKKVYEDEQVLAFYDINPSSKVHILVIPKGEYVSFDDFMQKAGDGEIVHFFKKVQEIAKDAGVSKTGYRIVTNHGKNSGQIVFHFHVHIQG
jgi:diadenosine tetraphosphate (Ap4A) HIT family hydrolase